MIKSVNLFKSIKSTAYFVGIILMTMIYSCANGPNYSDIPEIEFLSFDKTSMDQGLINDDFVMMTLYFQDGDGDIGFDDTNRDITLIDNRTGDTYEQFKLPVVPSIGTGNGISGDIMIKVFNQCCIYPNNIPPCEENPPAEFNTNDLSFTITLKDRAGNISNEITTPIITLNCN